MGAWMLLLFLGLMVTSSAFSFQTSRHPIAGHNRIRIGNSLFLTKNQHGDSPGDESLDKDGNGFARSRRRALHRMVGAAAMTTATIFRPKHPANAAPPIAIMAEELGYFPISGKDGSVTYVPKRVSRESTPQAVELAKLLQQKGVQMYGAYWCPHCSRQKELFGREAMKYLEYKECSPKGYGYAGQCRNVDGYPTFRSKNKKIDFSGERSLEYFAQQVGFTEFDPSLEDKVPMVGTACKLPKQ